MLAIVAIVIVTVGGGSSTATGSPSTSVATTEIKRQDLVENDEEAGTLGYSDSRDVVNHLTGYITWLPREGRVVRPDHTLYQVDRSPVILLSGSVPAYRTLDSSASGADVGQLEQNLDAFGYASGLSMTVDGEWTSATTAAVERWQDAHGLSQTGAIEFGRVVFQPGARRVSSVDATLGGSSSGSSGGSGTGAGDSAGATGASASTSDNSIAATASASSNTASAQTQTAVYRAAASNSTTQGAKSDTETTTPTPTTTTPSTGTTGPTGDDKPNTGKDKQKAKKKESKAGKGQPKSSGGDSTGTSAGAPAEESGSSAGSSGSSNSSVPTNTIMTTTSNRKTVTVNLDTTKSSLAKLRAKVVVTLPSGKTVHGRIVSIGKVATTSGSDSGSGSSSSDSSSSDETATIKLTIKLFSRGTALDQAPVTVRFEQSRAKDVLAIPVTALLAQPGDKFAVEVVDGSEHRLVTVEPGGYTSGYVEITGAGLRPGMRVTNAAVQ
ncbi:MAG: peptidoglycan-binding protein [Aeromicrobium sp.]